MNKQQALEQYYRFTQKDLEQNKRGIVSENQKKEVLRRQRLKVVKSLIVLALVILAVVAYVSFDLIRTGTTVKIPSQLSGMFFLGLAVFAGILVAPIFKRQDFTLKSVHGKVNFVQVIKQKRDDSRSDAHTGWNDPSRTRMVTYYEMHVGGESFHASDELMEIVQDGDTCQVYYTGSNDYIISIEILPQ